jgi:hypothetical protein
VIDQLGAFHSDYMAHHDREAEPSMQSRNLEQKSKKTRAMHAIAAGEAIVSQFICFNKLQVGSSSLFQQPKLQNTM